MHRVDFSKLTDTDLIVDAVYCSNDSKNISGEVLTKLLGVQNSGGFRKKKYNVKKPGFAYICIYTSGEELEWRDEIDRTLGTFTYWGDNRTAGNPIHNTKFKGNTFLSDSFEKLMNGKRENIPPVFIFKKYAGRDIMFLGLAVLGSKNININETLEIVWAQNSEGRYQNYKSIFTILDIPQIPREWLNDVLIGHANTSEHAPKVWLEWINKGKYSPLITEKNPILHRSKIEQIPDFNTEEGKMLLLLAEYFNDGYAFEKCAIQIVLFMDQNIIDIEGTSYFKDHGKDAIGTYRIGNSKNNIEKTFVVEAKYFHPKTSSSVDVKIMSRLVSRIQHREFGIMVTTSYVNADAYKEVVNEKLPIIIVSGKDIIEILIKNGIKNRNELQLWLDVNFDKSR